MRGCRSFVRQMQVRHHDAVLVDPPGLTKVRLHDTAVIPARTRDTPISVCLRQLGVSGRPHRRNQRKLGRSRPHVLMSFGTPGGPLALHRRAIVAANAVNEQGCSRCGERWRARRVPCEGQDRYFVMWPDVPRRPYSHRAQESTDPCYRSVISLK